MYIIYQIQYIGLKIAVVAPNQVEYIDSILTDQYKLLNEYRVKFKNFVMKFLSNT